VHMILNNLTSHSIFANAIFFENAILVIAYS